MVFEVLSQPAVARPASRVEEEVAAGIEQLIEQSIEQSIEQLIVQEIDQPEGIGQPGEVTGAGESDQLAAPALGPAPRPAEGDGARATSARPLHPAVLAQLLRSAVALQAEGLLRTAGALSGAWGNVLDRTAWIERDARDLSALTSAAVAAGATLPAGLDSGAGDPDHPSSVVEGLLAGHEALVRVLREIAGARCGSGEPATTGSLGSSTLDTGADGRGSSGGGRQPDGADPEPWRGLVRAVLDRREEEILMLRAVGAAGQLPAEQAYRRGRPPRH